MDEPTSTPTDSTDTAADETAETFTIPEDITPEQVDDTALGALSNLIAENATELARNPAMSEADVERLEALGVEYDRVNAEIDRRMQVAAQLAERASAAAERFSTTEPDDGEDDEPTPDDTPDDTPDTAEATVDTPATIVADGTPIARRLPSVELLRRRRPAGVAPVEEAPAGPRVAQMRATPVAVGAGFSAGEDLNLEQLARAITAKRLSFGTTIPAGVREELTIGQAVMDYPEDFMLGRNEQRNFAALDSVRRETQALVATGGSCAPLAPVYDIFRMATPHNPVEQALPVVGTPRGGIRWIVPPDFRAARSGIGVTTEAEDAAGYVVNSGPTANKPCVRVDCPDVAEDMVVAISQCVKFGNLNYRVFPEQVAAFLEDLAVAFAETKDRFYIDAMDAALGTTATGAPTGSTHIAAHAEYGANRSMMLNILQAADNYRLRNGMAIDATLEWWLPAWAPGLLKADMVNDLNLGMNFLGVSRAQVEAELRAWNLAITWYYHAPTGSGQGFNALQGQPSANVYPDTIVSYLFAPGTWARGDGGTLDVGLIRDSVLNQSNDLEIFSEQWIQVFKLGIESLRITHEVCPNGSGPDPVTAFDCSGS